ncbi:MAG: hypothetical protein GKR91_11485 [Pseudomonadales bacterium]|nr:hypothetical protein [Pseudomonadales bacterium]
MLNRRFPAVVSACIAFALVSLSAHGQTHTQNLDSYFDDVTAWGHPNLQGVWDRRTITPLERPERLAGKAFLTPEEIRDYERLSAERPDGRPLDAGRTSLSVHDPADLDYGSTVVATGQTSLVVVPSSGQIPDYTQQAVLKAEAQAKAREGRGPADSWIDRSLTERCITWGVPQSMLPQAYNNNLKIIQTATHVMFYIEMVHDVRIIPIDGRPHLPDSLRQWHGDSRGYWEGDTLVVRTKNFSEKSSFRRANVNLEIEERFRRNNEDQLEYSLKVMDDSTWEDDWAIAYPMIRGDEPIYEFACHEGNYGLINILSVARNLEKQNSER